MLPNIKFKGFTVPQAFFDELSEKIWILLDSAPSDATADVQLGMVSENSFEISIEIHSFSERFSACGRGKTLHQASKEVFDSVYSQIRNWRSHREFPTDLMDGTDTLPFSPHVLIVDDELSSTKMLETCLQETGCQITMVNSSSKAVNEMTNRHFDLVFIDWTMPEMDGGKTLSRAELLNSLDPQRRKQSAVPFVIYSGNDWNNIELPKSRDFQFVEHWQKAMSFPDLLCKTTRLLDRIRRHATANA